MTLAVVPVILAAATWYLLAMAEVTRWLWSRYPSWLLSWAECPACAGAWYCAAWTWFLGAWRGWEWFGVPVPAAVPLALLWGTLLVPVAARMQDWCLRTIGEPRR